MPHKRTTRQWQPHRDDLDPPVRRIVHAINEIDGISTFGSCGGHPSAEMTAVSAPEDWFYVSVAVLRNYRGWRGLGILVWAANEVDLEIEAWFNGTERGDGSVDFALRGALDQAEALADLLETVA
jgi:hypothetical protein